MRRALFLFGALATACGGGSEPAADGSVGDDGGVEPGWVSLPDVGSGPIQEIAVAELEGKIYVVGGFVGRDPSTITNLVQVFDPVSETWDQVAVLPAALHHVNAVGFNGKLYVLGGLAGGNFVATGSSWEYSPQDDEWTELASMPAGTERGASTIGVVDGRICVAGGFRNGMAVSDYSCFDPGQNSWDTGLPPLPDTLDHLVGAAVNDVFYAIGGRDGGISALRAAVHAFDPDVGSWQTLAPMPTPRGGCAAGVVGDRIVVVGGEGNSADPSGVFPQVEAYDTQGDSWEELGVMPTPRHGMGAVGIGDVLYVPGGADVQAFGAVATFEAFTVP